MKTTNKLAVNAHNELAQSSKTLVTTSKLNKNSFFSENRSYNNQILALSNAVQELAKLELFTYASKNN